MGRKWVGLAVALGAVWVVGGAGSALDATSPPVTQPFPLRVPADFPLTVVPLDVDLPAEGAFELRLDWFTKEARIVDPGSFAPGQEERVAGCVFTAPTPVVRWMHEPPAVGEACAHDYLHLAPRETTLVCGGVLSTCYVDGYQFSFIEFGYFVLSCKQSGAAMVAWPSGAMTPPESVTGCTLLMFGTEPTQWFTWDSLCYAAPGPGVEACLHRQPSR